MDETAQAFEHPHARASATHAGPPLDRISVRDYVRDIEIGAFRSERGVTQRLRFNVVLEVAHHAAGDDDVDRVVSYDSITDAIEAAMATQRLNLLETLAERVAAGCLADPRAVRVFVRIEKLDRIPGSLGVEIVRSRVDPATPRLRPIADVAQVAADRPHVVVLPPTLAADAASAWRDEIAAWGRPVITVAVPAPPATTVAAAAARHIGLLAIDQAAWTLAGTDPRFEVTATRTELDWAARTGRLPVWAPARMLEAARGDDLPGVEDPDALGAWLAQEIGAAALVVVGGDARAGAGSVPVKHLPADDPAALRELR